MPERLKWDEVGERLYETGISNGVLYVSDGAGGYAVGVPWNGLTAVTESPSGAEASPLFANNAKYLSMVSAEEFGATVEAYTYPKEWAACDGSKELAVGVKIGQQPRVPFCLVYKTLIGNDVEGDAHGYKLHLVYGAMAAPSERAFQSVNDSPEATTFSWEITTTPVPVAGSKPSATLEIDSTTINAAKLAEIEDKLFGSATETAGILMPDEILAIINAAG